MSETVNSSTECGESSAAASRLLAALQPSQAPVWRNTSQSRERSNLTPPYSQQQRQHSCTATTPPPPTISASSTSATCFHSRCIPFPPPPQPIPLLCSTSLCSLVAMLGNRVGRSVASRVATRVGVPSSASLSASSVPRRFAGDHHGPQDNWPKTQDELRRLWGYGAATLAVFVYAGYSISGPAPAKTTTTTTTVQTIKH